MQQFRRLMARQLVRLARWFHYEEAAPAPPIIQQVAQSTPALEIPIDYEWQEERIAQLHAANRDLATAARRWERAYDQCLGELKELKRALDERTGPLAANLRATLRGETD